MKLRIGGFLIVWIQILSGMAVASAPLQEPAQALKFGGDFSELDPAQQQLVRTWYRHFNQTMGAQLSPEVAYGELPFSVRTTFEAVTNGAMKTKLTDGAGQSLGTALDLVRLVEAVRGEVSKARGDVQFRIYAVLIPGAVDILERSVQFKRGRDNTHYHVDYPVNYRLEDTPSLQFSITEDGSRADIDIDYRSSSFPKLFFDGHLKAANSDVRAWDNYDVHIGRWQGLVNWWRNLFGLALKTTSAPKLPAAEERTLYPPNPPISDHEDLSVAVADYLTAWLVRQEPEQAMPYYAATSYACIRELEPGSQTSDMAPLRILRDMREVNDVLREIQHLEEAVEAVKPADETLEPMKNAHASVFSVARIPPQMVPQLECRDTNESIALRHDESYRDYFAVGMKLKQGHGTELFQVWTKQEGYWKIAAFHLEHLSETATVPDSRSRTSRRPAVEGPVTVDPGLVARVEDFMESWLVQKDEATAVNYFSAKSYGCVGLFDDPPQPPGPDPRARLEQDLKSFAQGLGAIASLETAISATDPWNPALHRIAHEQQNAYTLTSYSVELARQQDCRLRRHELSNQERQSGKRGDFFAVHFQLRKTGESPPILTLVWSKEKKDWEIISFDVELN